MKILENVLPHILLKGPAFCTTYSSNAAVRVLDSGSPNDRKLGNLSTGQNSSISRMNERTILRLLIVPLYCVRIVSIMTS